jgi:mitogen-activated protein kinase 1/3
MARAFESEEEETEYVATRWYRAPEVILSWKHYTKGIDLWAVGCIFAELLGRTPLFPGQDYLHQISRIVEVIGAPSEDDLRWIANEQAKNYVRALGPKPKIPFATLYPHAPPAAHSLLEGLLAFNPAKRLTAEQALSHPYFAGLHDPNDEPDCPRSVEFDFEDAQLEPSMYRELIYREMAHFHPELLTPTMPSLNNIVNPVNMMTPMNNQMML